MINKRYTGQNIGKINPSSLCTVAEWLVIVAREFYFEDGRHNYESFWTGARDLFGWRLEFVRFTFIRPQPSSLLLSIPFPHLRRSWCRPYTTWRGVTSACSTFREREEEAAHSCHCADRDAMADERLELFQSSTLTNVSAGMRSTDGIEKNGEYQVSCLHFREESGALWWLGRWIRTWQVSSSVSESSNSDSDSSTQFCREEKVKGLSNYGRGFDSEWVWMKFISWKIVG